jgi:hypothetical protein
MPPVTSRLPSGEKARLAGFVAGIPLADRRGAAWVEVERLLKRLGR